MSFVVDHVRAPGVEAERLELADGGCVAVTGPSGAGKTLLMRALADLDPNEGAVVLDGAGRRAMTAGAWRRKVAYVPAETGWWADRVGEHFPDHAAARERLSALLLDDGALDWQVARLSTGERQRLGFLRAFLMRPRVLLLDEPTSALDTAARDALEAVLTQFLADGGMIVIVTHDAAQAKRLGAQVVRIEAGRLMAGSP